MKQLFILIIAAILLLPGCKFINEKILKKESDTLLVYSQKLEEALQSTKDQHLAELQQIQNESQATIDSIINYYENELAAKGSKPTGATAGTYYLVVGSFKTPEYAVNYAAKVKDMGYETEIVKVGSWNFVSAESYSSWREAITGLDIVRSGVAVNSWIYIAR